MTIAIVDWGTRRSSLAFVLLRFANVVTIEPGEDPHNAYERVCAVAVPGAVLFHTCLSLCRHVPKDRLQLAERLAATGISCFNAQACDVTKRAVQCACQALGLPSTAIEPQKADPNTVVIVKTNWNYGGYNERLLSARLRHTIGISQRDPPIARFNEYIIDRLGAIPTNLLQDELLIVERFIENAQNCYFRVYVAGASVVVSRAVNPAPIKKMLPGLERQNEFCTVQSLDALSPPARLVARAAILVCRALSVQFGACDVVIDDEGRPYVIDVNPTPGWGDEHQAGMLEHLREGLLTGLRAPELPAVSNDIRPYATN